MSITILRPSAVTVEITGRGYGTAENAATIAAKLAGWKVRGSRYYGPDGSLYAVNRAEAALILRGYRWVIQHAGRWFVAVPGDAQVAVETPKAA
jgi:hypothetical protein